jgi:hypothetical protein
MPVSRLAVESAQTAGTLSVRVEGYDDQVLEIAYLFSALILGCQSGVWVDLTTYACAETPSPINPASKGEASVRRRPRAGGLSPIIRSSSRPRGCIGTSSTPSARRRPKSVRGRISRRSTPRHSNASLCSARNCRRSRSRRPAWRSGPLAVTGRLRFAAPAAAFSASQ